MPQCAPSGLRNQNHRKQLFSAFLFFQQKLFVWAYQGQHHVIWNDFKAEATPWLGSVLISRWLRKHHTLNMIILGSARFAFCYSLLFCLLLGKMLAMLLFLSMFYQVSRVYCERPALVSGCVPSDSTIATVGTDVTLTCNYDADSYGRLSVCWGRGNIPNRGCANEVINSDGTSVTSRLSERYLLVGDLGKGDVSLTIRQVQESDSGVYGCRVDIPGWFNDHKHEETLTVVAGETQRWIKTCLCLAFSWTISLYLK